MNTTTKQDQEYINKILGKAGFYYFQTYGFPVEMFIEEVENEKKRENWNDSQFLLFCKLLEKEYKL